jgi:LPXTG-motif cell wall-anchored protein
MEDLTFNVDADWTEPAPFTCVNIPHHYEFVKTDNEGHPMAGVKFTLEDANGNVLNDLVSGEDGIVHVTGLKPGRYIIREIETREGYSVSGETIEVVIDEKYVVPAEMYVLVNYPSIQTGVDFEITPLMWGGGAAALLGLILLIVFIRRRRR